MKGTTTAQSLAGMSSGRAEIRLRSGVWSTYDRPGKHIDGRTAQLSNPIDSYPRSPFKRQTQQWPGLASRMEPPPDHGEKSYRGSGRLAGRKALITGGDSGMGHAAAIAYAREGADVAINYLPAEESDAREVVGTDQGRGANYLGHIR
jgi:hypothetical protein